MQRNRVLMKSLTTAIEFVITNGNSKDRKILED